MWGEEGGIEGGGKHGGIRYGSVRERTKRGSLLFVVIVSNSVMGKQNTAGR